MPKNGSIMRRLHSAHHGVIVGATGSGKTFFATKYAKLPLNCLFINPQAELSVSRAADVCLEGEIDPATIWQAMADRRVQMVEWIPPLDVIETQEIIEQLRNDVFSAHRFGGKRLLTIIIDEADIYAPKQGKNPIDGIFQRGRRYGVQGIAITQRPQLISHTVLTQAERHVIFQTNLYELEYYTKKGVTLPTDWLQKKYHFIEVDNIGNVTKHTPV